CLEARAILDRTAGLPGRTSGRAQPARVKMFAGPHIFERMLRAALPEFCRTHPQIELEVVAEWPAQDLGMLVKRRELDLALFTVVGGPIPPDAHLVGEVPCVVVASARLVGRRKLS